MKLWDSNNALSAVQEKLQIIDEALTDVECGTVRRKRRGDGIPANNSQYLAFQVPPATPYTLGVCLNS